MSNVVPLNHINKFLKGNSSKIKMKPLTFCAV